MEKLPAMSHHSTSLRRTSTEQRNMMPPSGSNPPQSERSARRSLGEAGGLLLRSGQGLRGGSGAVAIAESARAGALSPQSPSLPTGGRNRPSALSAGTVLAPSRQLAQPALPAQQHRQREQQPRSRRAASFSLNNPGSGSSETQPRISVRANDTANAAGSTQQRLAPQRPAQSILQRPILQADGAASSPPGGNLGVHLDMNATAAAMEGGNRELLARVRELAMLQRQLLVLQQGVASLQVAVSRARPGEDEDAVAAPANRGHRGSAAADRIRAAGTEPSAEVGGDMELHLVSCDGCGAGPPLAGRVMRCVECDDYDLCARCYADRDRNGHPRGHQFRRLTGEGPDLSRQVMLRVLESTMLREALHRSSERDVDREAAEKELAEVRAAETISALPHVTWSAGTQQNNCSECALCLEEYTEGEEVLKLSCAHLFHEACIGPWFVKSLSCPLCQKEVSA